MLFFFFVFDYHDPFFPQKLKDEIALTRQRLNQVILNLSGLSEIVNETERVVTLVRTFSGQPGVDSAALFVAAATGAATCTAT